MKSTSDPIAVIGAGPAGLMAAEVLALAGVPVELFDAMPSSGRKFLVAGKGGLNLTHSEPLPKFLTRYGARRRQLEPFLNDFGPEQIRLWASTLGIDTFIGSSGRVFPVGMRSAPLLRLWLTRLRNAGVIFHYRHKWIGWNEAGALQFITPNGQVTISTNAQVLALGGASWPITGSNADWVPILSARAIPVNPLKPSNCGFDVAWSQHFRTRYAGQPVKTVKLSFPGKDLESFEQIGEFIITENGVEGSLIYACSSLLRDAIDASGKAVLHLDLAPAWSYSRLLERICLPRGSHTLSTHLERSVGIKGVKAGLLWEFVPKTYFTDPEKLALSIEDLPVPLIAARPIEEAISSAGGVPFEELDEHLMLRSMPGVFCAGEMLDWEAPTGGYLLTACFSTGRAAALGVLDWLSNVEKGIAR